MKYLTFIKKAIIKICFLGTAGLAVLLFINLYVVGTTKGRILTVDKASELDADCILVLGAGVHPNGNPSNMLEDRLLRGIELYDENAAGKLLMSGDHGRVSYDEVNTMKEFAIDKGVPSSDVFMDHAGFSTYESMYRARDIFKAKKVIIVTQKYHLYRALYSAKKLGLDAWGVASDQRTYYGQSYRDAREILARSKDFLITIWKPEPTYLGKAVPVSGNGDATNDKQKETEGRD
jgi:vancomycin permeability regulator SanA